MLLHCHNIVIASGNGFFAALFMAALVGSFTHCTSMCGPFVLAQSAKFAVPEGKNPARWYKSLLLPYHLGRMTTYTGLGITATALSAPLLQMPAFALVPPLMLVIAAVIFLASAFSYIFPGRFSGLNLSFCNLPSWITVKIAAILPKNSLFSGYLLGIFLGFLPCGLVYAAIIASSATGNILQAAAGMVTFALGTMPALMLVSGSGRLLHTRFRLWVKPLSAGLMLINSMMLFIMAAKGFL